MSMGLEITRSIPHFNGLSVPESKSHPVINKTWEDGESSRA